MHIKGTRILARHIRGRIAMINSNAVAHSPHISTGVRMICILNKRNYAICDVTNLFQDATLSPAYLPLKLPKGFSTYPM